MKKGRKPNVKRYELIMLLRRGEGTISGKSINEISKVLKCSKQNIYYFLHNYGDIK